MSWVTVIWSMFVSSCFTLAVAYLYAWWRKPTTLANLFFSLLALGSAWIAAGEFWLMRTATPAEYAFVTRWLHVPIWLVVLAEMAFILTYLRAGRRWLACTICGIRTIALVLNFLVGQNLNYLEVRKLRAIPFLGETVSVADGVVNPLMSIGQLSMLLLLIFIVDATIAIWRRGDHRQALVVGGSLIFYHVAATAQVLLVVLLKIEAPVIMGLYSIFFVLVMSIEMSREALRTDQLSNKLKLHEKWLKLAMDSTGTGFWSIDAINREIRATDQACTMFGVVPGDSLNVERFLSEVDVSDRDLVSRLIDDAFRDKKEFNAEYRIVLPDENVHWIAVRGGVLGFARRITRHRGSLHRYYRAKTARDDAAKQRGPTTGHSPVYCRRDNCRGQ